MKIYYAHCLAIYNTPQEERDLQTLKDLGFEVLNPNTYMTDAAWNHAKTLYATYEEAFTAVFGGLVGECQAFAFRALPDGAIPKGVARELEIAQQKGLPIIELPSRPIARSMGIEETREYLREIGQR